MAGGSLALQALVRGCFDLGSSEPNNHERPLAANCLRPSAFCLRLAAYSPLEYLPPTRFT